MAFSLEESSPLNSEQRVAIIGTIPGEGVQSIQGTQESTSESPVTTTFTPTTEDNAMTTEDSDKKLEILETENQNNETPTLLIANTDDDEEKTGENGDEKTNPRLVFIERLMGLHLSAPLNGQKEEEKEENSAEDNEQQMPFRYTIKTVFIK